MFDYLVQYAANFFVVLISIAAFSAPFMLIFWWRNRHEIRQSRPHFNYFMERFMMSQESNYLVMIWAASEAIFWFIIPEFLLILVIFMKIHRKFDLVKYDIIGTVIGTVIGFMIHVSDTTFLKVPYIYQRMLDQAHVWFDQMGVWGLVNQPFSGVPYKAFIHEAQDFGFFLPFFIVIAVVARIVRYIIIYEATKALYPFCHKFVRKHYGILIIFATAIFTALLLRVTMIYQ
jgi:membrane protein YqaA with SNARE-associated domain